MTDAPAPSKTKTAEITKEKTPDPAAQFGGVAPDAPKIDLTDLPASAKVTPIEQQHGKPLPPVDPVVVGATEQNPAEAKALAAKERIEKELGAENPDDRFA